jgi:hypothetical protein
MEQSISWQASSHSTSQEFTHLLWDTAVHLHLHKSPPPPFHTGASAGPAESSSHFLILFV